MLRRSYQSGDPGRGQARPSPSIVEQVVHAEAEDPVQLAGAVGPAQFVLTQVGTHLRPVDVRTLPQRILASLTASAGFTLVMVG